ncbi:M29 family metallopeptidase [Fusibacter bizertensis]
MKLYNWFGDTSKSNLHLVTDSQQLKIAEWIQAGLNYNSCTIHNIDESEVLITNFEKLNPNDYLVVILSFDSFIYKAMNRLYPTFRKPNDIVCRYVFIRLDISLKSLIEGLNTDDQLVKAKINHYLGVKNESQVTVISETGTSVSFRINKFGSFNHFISDASDTAFLPPSEIYAGIHLGSANGEVVVDLTLGQLHRDGKLLEKFGLISSPFKLIVANGKIVNVIGNDLLKQQLSKFEDEASAIVELGIGLSQMEPTGIIGIDESILGTCHFGIGDGSFYGIDNKASIHLDVVLKDPQIRIKS